jgi:hypothetical protein
MTTDQEERSVDLVIEKLEVLPRINADERGLGRSKALPREKDQAGWRRSS